MLNKLRGSYCYLCGPIDFKDDGGYGWRNEITPVLKEMGVKILNPLDKPIVGHLEDPATRSIRRQEQKQGKFKKIYEERIVRRIDLKMVDKSDFVLVYFRPDDRPFGTVEEISWANRLKRPVIVITPGGNRKCSPWLIWMIGWKTIFPDFKKAIKYLRGIDNGSVRADKRWIFFDPERI